MTVRLMCIEFEFIHCYIRTDGCVSSRGFTVSMRFSIPSSWIFLIVLVLSAPLLAADTTGDKLTPEETFAMTRKALSGDGSAISWFKSRSEESSWHAYIVAAAYDRKGEISTAEKYYKRAISLGDSDAVLALAYMFTDAVMLNKGYAWSQIALLGNYDKAEIQEGKANATFEMWLLQKNLNAIDETDINGSNYSNAQELTQKIASEWLQPVREAVENRSQGYKWPPIQQNQPTYPSELAQRRISGWTFSSLLVGKGGKIKDVIVVSSSHEKFSRSAEAALRQWEFRPPENVGKEWTARQVIYFNLDD